MSGNMYDLKKMAQETQRVNKELNIERWVKITIYIEEPDKTIQPLYTYDIPSYMVDRSLWIVRWTRAKFLCQYPRKSIKNTFVSYDKNSGLEMRFGSLLDKLTTAKSTIFKVEDRIQEYINYWTEKDPMFYNPDADQQLIEARRKLEKMQKDFEVLYQKVQEAAENKLID